MLKEKELKFLVEERKKHPDLFKQKTFLDDAEFLKNFGFFLEQKGVLPSGYLKLWPQDFIVEEVPKNERIQTVDLESFLNQKKNVVKSGPTIYATLVKCGLSTLEAIEEINSFLELSKNKIQFSGIKDKDALTGQLISFRETTIEKLRQIESPYLFLKNVYSGKGAIEIGGLRGNQFIILVRTDDSFREKSFLENLEKIEKEGFYNFFYLQRFGSPRLINFYWGFLILKGEYQKAILSFLSSAGQREIPYFKKLRETIKENSGNWEKIEKILEPFPLIFQNEAKVIKYLKEKPRDFIGALNQIPEQVQLWVFAYASLLFNRKLSSFLEKEAEPPEKMPLILSKDKNDWLEYFDFLKEDGIQLPSDPVLWEEREKTKWPDSRIPTALRVWEKKMKKRKQEQVQAHKRLKDPLTSLATLPIPFEGQGLSRLLKGEKGCCAMWDNNFWWSDQIGFFGIALERTDQGFFLRQVVSPVHPFDRELINEKLPLVINPDESVSLERLSFGDQKFFLSLKMVENLLKLRLGDEKRAATASSPGNG